MDPARFETIFGDIRQLDATEGPNKNVLEPKFEARDKVLELVKAIEGSHKDKPSLLALKQLSRIAAFLGQNYYDCEEDKEAEASHGHAFVLARLVAEGRALPLEDVKPATVEEVLRFQFTDLPANVAWADGAVLIEALNAMGVFLSARSSVRERTDDARTVLHVAEQCYAAAVAHPDGVDMAELEKLHTNTHFYLAQAYTALGKMVDGSRYCHTTMVRQMQYKLEFSKKEWATNAVHLAGFYAAEGHFGEAKHSLDAARVVMPSQPADEETLGVVAWGYGKFYKALLRQSALRKESGASDVVPPVDNLRVKQWWMNFPVEGVSPPQEYKLCSTFDEAREAFRAAVLELQRAGTFYAFETSCPDHIAIQQDIAECYKWIAVFETDVERQAAMMQRRLDTLSKFPDQLSFTAYATLIRQLYFDLGDMASDLFDLRLAQKQQQQQPGAPKPLSDKKINELGANARGYFVKFVDSYNDKNGVRPTKFEREALIPIFRALMRIARLESKVLCKSAEEEYHVVGNAIRRYDEVVKIIEDNAMDKIADMVTEVRLAREMKTLLPGKQRDLMRAFNRSS